jgi:hypothetical protein
MACKITVIQKPTYTHFIVEGENSVENTLYYSKEIYQESIANNYRRILIEERLEGKRLDTMDIYEVSTKAAENYSGFYKAVAYVNILTDKKSFSFVENICFNRSIPIRAFATVEEAEKWLTS